MSVSRKVLRRMKKVMVVIGASAVLVPCSSQISYAGKKKGIFKVTTLERGKTTKLESWTDNYNDGNGTHYAVRYEFDYSSGTLTVSGNGPMRKGWQGRLSEKLRGTNNINHNKNRKSRNDRICKVIIQQGITGIQEDALSCLRYLNNVIIPNSVTTIGKCAFSDCTSLEKITIPNSVTTIGDCAFSSCKSLERINIPNSVTSIGSWAFASTSLKSITIPYSVTSIGEWAFYNCKVKEIIFANRGCTRDWANIAHVLRYIPRKNGGASFSSRKAFNFAGIVYGFLQNCKVGKFAFYACTELRKVIILMNVVFAYEAFKECNKIFRELLEGSEGIHGTVQLDNSINLDT